MTSARKLVLHIGFPKTGSSAIQAWLAKSSGELARLGIAYRNFHERAADDEISSGNGGALVEVLRAREPGFGHASRKFEQGFIATYFGDLDSAIISSEALATAAGRRLGWFREYCAARHISVSILGYCRTIYDHCYSSYQQLVKRHGETCTFEEYAATYASPQFRCIWTWHSVFAGAVGIRLYDAAKKDLIADFVRQAGIAHLGLSTEQGNVNRSLTFREVELLRRLNVYHKGALSGRLSDALIYADPAKEPSYRFDSAIAADFERRFGSDVQKVNEQFFPGGRDRLAVSRPPEGLAQEPGPQEPALDLDPMIEIALRALSEGAAEAREREQKLRGRLSMAQARNAVAAENWDIAVTYLQRVLKIDPDNAEASSELQDVYARLGGHEGAELLRRKAKGLEQRTRTPAPGASGRKEQGGGQPAGRSEEPPITPATREAYAMNERDSDDAAVNRDRSREARRSTRNERAASTSGAPPEAEASDVAARKETRDRLAYIRIRLQEIAEEREHLVAERSRLLEERKEGRASE